MSQRGERSDITSSRISDSDASSDSDIIILDAFNEVTNPQSICKAKLVFSFDIGTRNLAYACAEIASRPPKIIDCELFDLSEEGEATGWIPRALVAIVNELLTRHSQDNVSSVLIERQIEFMGGRNSRYSLACVKNTQVEYALHAAFEAKGIRVTRTQPPSTCYPQMKNLSYYKRKKMSVKLLTDLIESSTILSPSVVSYIQACDKKDDISDCILSLALYI